MRNESRYLVLCLCIATLQPCIAFAQDTRLEEIIVTAQRREQRLVDVPMSIRSLSGADLDQRGISSIQDLGFAVPGLTMREDGPGSYTIFMRGMSNQYGTGALVGVYLDEAPLSLTGYDQMDSRVLDLERVEVLKGPQGTLYGQGSLAGAVRFITRRPDLDDFSGSIDASYGWLDSGEAKQSYTGVLNVPVASGTFGLRLAGTVERGGGWQDQPAAGIEDGNDQELEHFRLRALWAPIESLDVEAMIVMHRNEVELGLGYENPDRTAPVAIDPARVLIPKKFDYDLYNLDITYDFGGFELLSATTYIDNDHDYPFSYFGGPQTIYGGDLEGTDARYSEADQFSQEVRLASTGDGPLTWTVGGFYRDVDTSLFALYDTLYFGVLYPDAEYFNADSYEQVSIFADASYKFFDRLTVGAGVRYFEDDQENTDGETVQTASFDSVDPRFYATYALSDDVNVYANIASGFRSGGINGGDLPNYDPEQAWSYEIGAKGNVAGGTLSFEVAAYYTDYDDMLRRGLVFAEEDGFLSATSNLGKVEIKGAEGGITWLATEALTFTANVTYLDSEVKEINGEITDPDANQWTSFPGDPVDYVPEWSYTVGANYDFELAPELPGYARLDYSYRDKVSYVDRTSFPNANVPQFSDDLSLLDARIGFDWRSLWFEAFGTNLTNENKWIDPYHAWSNANRTRPRMIGLRIGYKFD